MRRLLIGLVVLLVTVGVGYYLLSEPAPSPESIELATASNWFGFDLYKQVAKKPGNHLVSPLGAHLALTMTAAGARNATLDEMRKTLSLPASDDKVDRGYRDLLRQLNRSGGAVEFHTTQVVFGQSGVNWNRDFTSRLARYYSANVSDVDFSRPDAVRTVNEWAAKETKGKIPSILEPEASTADSQLVLASAVYFKGEWTVTFNRDHTREAPFTRSDGTTRSVPMMHRKGGFRLSPKSGTNSHSYESEVYAAEIPYRGEQFSMIILLPKDHKSLPELEKKLGPESLAGWLAGLESGDRVELDLPKFRLESAHELADPLVSLGMTAAFSNRADFSGMRDSGELFINRVTQKSFVEVNEEGTEAAAATTVSLVKSLPPAYEVNRPFLFLIRHNPTNTILLLGRFVEP